MDSLRTNGLKPGLLLDVVGSPTLIQGEPALREIVSRRIGIIGTNEVWPGGLDSSVAGRASTNVLTSIEQIRSLKPEDAAREIPVRIRGVVTFYYPNWGSLFVQDTKAGIYVDVGEQELDLNLEDWIELEGVTAAGDYAPMIVRSRFQPLGRAPLPPARHYSLMELSSGSQDSQWVGMDGVIHSVKMESGHFTLDVAEPGGHFEVIIPSWGNQPAPPHLVDATVRLEGACGTTFNQKRQLMGVRLFVPSLDFVKTERSAPADPFALPLRTIGSLFQLPPALNPTIACGFEAR